MLEQEKIFLREQQQNKFLKMLGGKKNAGETLKDMTGQLITFG